MPELSDSTSLDYDSIEELLTLCKQHQCSISEIALQREVIEKGKTSSEIITQLSRHYATMRDSVRKGLAIKKRSISGLSGGDAAKILNYAETEKCPLLGKQFARTIAYGYAVLEYNAQFGRIIATPTAGSAGVVPACLLSLEDMQQVTAEAAAHALLTAAAIGVVIGKKAFFSGARGGCQAEVGSASCMAAAVITEVMGGTPEQVCGAAAYALMNTLGMVCDPIGGYVEIPCVSRNGMFAVHSFLASTMALSGAQCIVPLDDVITAMNDIGRRMPRALKETSEGGLATTPTGLKYKLPGFTSKATNVSDSR